MTDNEAREFAEWFSTLPAEERVVRQLKANREALANRDFSKAAGATIKEAADLLRDFHKGRVCEPGKIEFVPDEEPVSLRLARRILDMAEAGKGLSLSVLAEEIERWWSPLVEVKPEPAEHDQRVVDLARQMAHAAMVDHESVWGSPRLAAARACLDEVERLGKRAGHVADNNQAMLHAIHTWRRMHQPAKGK